MSNTTFIDRVLATDAGWGALALIMVAALVFPKLRSKGKDEP